MVILEGFEFRIEINEVSRFAECLLHFTNIKCHRTGIFDIRTVEGTNYLIIVADNEYREQFINIGASYGVVDSISPKSVFIFDDDDSESVAEIDINKALSDDEDIYFVGIFDNH